MTVDRMALLQLSALNPFRRICKTVCFDSSSVGASDGSHFRLCVCHETVAGGDVVEVLTFADELLEFGQQGFLQGEG
jgi:hypothetical protein